MADLISILKNTIEHTLSPWKNLMLNLTPKYSVNAYGIFTKKSWWVAEPKKAPDFYGRQIFN